MVILLLVQGCDAGHAVVDDVNDDVSGVGAFGVSIGHGNDGLGNGSSHGSGGVYGGSIGGFCDHGAGSHSGVYLYIPSE